MKIYTCRECGIKIKSQQLDHPCPACGSNDFVVKEEKIQVFRKTPVKSFTLKKENSSDRKKEKKKIAVKKKESVDEFTHKIICRKCRKVHIGNYSTKECKFCHSKRVELYYEYLEIKEPLKHFFEFIRMMTLSIFEKFSSTLYAIALIITCLLLMYFTGIYKLFWEESSINQSVINFYLALLFGIILTVFAKNLLLLALREWYDFFNSIICALFKKDKGFFSTFFRFFDLIMLHSFKNIPTFFPSTPLVGLLVIKKSCQMFKNPKRDIYHKLDKVQRGTMLTSNDRKIKSEKDSFYKISYGAATEYIPTDNTLDITHIHSLLRNHIVIISDIAKTNIHELPDEKSEVKLSLSRKEYCYLFYSIQNGERFMSKRPENFWCVMVEPGWYRVYKNYEELGYMRDRGLYVY